jgi:hypothetical protein
MVDPYQFNSAGSDWIDVQIGSLLEAWLTRDTPGCDYCNETLDEDEVLRDGGLTFCDSGCRSDYQTVREARLVIGERDLRQRGFD